MAAALAGLRGEALAARGEVEATGVDPAGPALQRGFAPALVEWQRQHGRRGLPWQGNRDPYRVWLSEIMLQQTQVATVLGYYRRFLDRFPNVAALATAPVDDVLAAWSGLGYYSRARNLHRCARVVMEAHGGAFPRTSDALVRLPGIGRSTAAAIAAFCFGEKVAILDGNVKRVLSRVLAFEGDLGELRSQNLLWSEATSLLPEAGIESYTQGLMDLGATLCTQRAPACLLCPVASLCAANLSGTQERYPIKSRRLRRGSREHVWLWLRSGAAIWLVQRPLIGIWAGLWSFPEYPSVGEFERATEHWPGDGEPLPSFVHTLTHLDWTLHPIRWSLPPGATSDAVESVTSGLPGGRWFSVEEALAVGLPAPLRKLLRAAFRPAELLSR